MKFTKNILVLASLFTVSLVNARTAGGRSTSATTKTRTSKTTRPITQAKTYKQLRDEIRRWKSTEVIGKDGNLLPEFIDFVKNNAEQNSLSDTFVEALLQAGLSFHAQAIPDALMGEALGANSRQIQKIMNDSRDLPTTKLTSVGKVSPEKPALLTQQFEADYSAIAPLSLQPIEKDITASDLTALFYDDNTNLLNQDYLKKQVNELFKTKEEKDIVITLTKEYAPKMLLEWTNKGLSNKGSLAKKLTQQITDAVANKSKKWQMRQDQMQQDEAKIKQELKKVIENANAQAGKTLAQQNRSNRRPVGMLSQPIEIISQSELADLFKNFD